MLWIPLDSEGKDLDGSGNITIIEQINPLLRKILSVFISFQCGLGQVQLILFNLTLIISHHHCTSRKIELYQPRLRVDWCTCAL